MRFVLSGKMNKEKYQGKIEALGGKVKNTVDKDTLALISDKGRNNTISFSLLYCSVRKQFNKGRGKGNNGISIEVLTPRPTLSMKKERI